MPTHCCRLLLVDDHERIREALRTLLSAHDDIQIVGEASNGEEAVTRVASCKPDVILMDINMPKMNGIQAASVIKKARQDIVIIGLCVAHDRYTTEAFLKAGAVVVVSKDQVDGLYATIQGACAKLMSAPSDSTDPLGH